jgi:hypothetical protein
MKISKVMEGPRDGEVRCLTCFERFRPAEGAERAKCPPVRNRMAHLLAVSQDGQSQGAGLGELSAWQR